MFFKTLMTCLFLFTPASLSGEWNFGVGNMFSSEDRIQFGRDSLGGTGFVLAQKSSDVSVKGRQGVDIAENPFSQVDQVTEKLIDVILYFKDEYPDNEEAFFSEINEVLNPHVDFDYMARMVMGPYKKVATREQRDLFSRVFRMGLIETYGRGLVSFNNEKILLINRHQLEDGQRKVSVRQEIHGADKIYPLSYTMRRKKTGKWMITNVTINGINLGKTLLNQFVQSARKNSGNIDYVIANWSSEAV